MPIFKLASITGCDRAPCTPTLVVPDYFKYYHCKGY